MNRFQKRSLLRRIPSGQTVGFLFLMGFVLFVSLRILTPPTQVVQSIASPDQSREARLMVVYYHSEPDYKISTRSGRFWQSRFRYSNPEGVSATNQTAALSWSDDSKQLFFDIDGERVWERRIP